MGEMEFNLVRWLEAEWQQERARFSAAIPSSVLRTVIADVAPEAVARRAR